MQGKLKRREVLGQIAGICTSCVLFGLVTRVALAQDKISPDDPLARSLGYVEDASRSARSDASQRCGVCLQFNGQADWGACNIFAGRMVSAQGWCTAFVKRV